MATGDDKRSPSWVPGAGPGSPLQLGAAGKLILSDGQTDDAAEPSMQVLDVPSPSWAGAEATLPPQTPRQSPPQRLSRWVWLCVLRLWVLRTR